MWECALCGFRGSHDDEREAMQANAEHMRERHSGLDVTKLRARLNAIREIVNAQAEDGGLWFVAEYATEAYLQQELRRLHAAIEVFWEAGLEAAK
jgi:predicted small metal-binding protein